MKLYNSLTKKTEDFKPLSGNTAKIYTCGPTVYNFAHIGNLRAYVFADVLVKTLRYFGFEIKRVMNITDVGHLTSDADSGEDKMEKGARREGKTAWEVAKIYEQAFFRDLTTLNIEKPEIIAKATEHISEQIELIKTLEKKGFTYRIADGVYFDTSKFKDYGKLAGQKLSELKEGARVEKNMAKKNPTDFALWKFSPKGVKRDMEWDSPWGTGFPGWHIECSAMAMKYLGESIDIHTGGVDLIAMHHTNEMAQSEAATGKPFARFFMHNEYLLSEKGDKMAKSGGQFLTLDILKKEGINPLALRYLYLTAHYRDKLQFSMQALKAAEEGLKALQRFAAEQAQGSDTDVETDIKEAEAVYDGALQNDLNTPQALAALWNFKKEINRKGIKSKAVFAFLKDADAVLGLDLNAREPNAGCDLSEEVKKILIQRERARKNKNFTEADRLRQKLIDLGYSVEDTIEGTALWQNGRVICTPKETNSSKLIVEKGVGKVIKEYGDVLNKLNKE